MLPPDPGISALLLPVSAETSDRFRVYPDVPSGLRLKPWSLPLVITESEELSEAVAVSSLPPQM